jgi:hypothetical protein
VVRSLGNVPQAFERLTLQVALGITMKFCHVCNTEVEEACYQKGCPVKPKLTWSELKTNKIARRDIYIILGFAVLFSVLIAFIYS